MKKDWINKKFVLVILFFIMLTAGCQATDTNTDSRIMAQQTAYELINNSTDDIIIIDVRTPAEFAEEHIPNSINWPLWEIENTYLMPLFETDITMLIICRSGNRSQQATALLIEMGFANVYDIGGILTWPGETITIN